MQINNVKALFLLAALVSLGAMNAWAVQGQWAAFVYLFPKSDASMNDSSVLARLAHEISEASAGFSNDFTPQKDNTDTVQYIRVTKYLLEGKSVSDKPAAVIRAESTDQKVLEEYVESLAQIVTNHFRIETRFAVTRELNYTDEETLQRLKDKAPKRGTGEEQPNAVVFPLSKTSDWWTQPTDKRKNYFFANPALFGKDHLGHNGVGFKFIQRIFRKLYHSRFTDPQQDFMTYFEYGDKDADTFDALLSGLRDTTHNQEWKYVEEKPIVYGKRMATPEEMLKP